MIDLNKIARTIEVIVDKQAKALSEKGELSDKECVSLEKITRVLVILDERRLKQPKEDPYKELSTEDLEAEFD